MVARESAAFASAVSSGGVSVARFDLSTTATTHYWTMAFLKLCGDTVLREGLIDLRFEFPGADPKLRLALHRLGFSEDGRYLHSPKRVLEPRSVFETAGGAVLKILEDAGKLLLYARDLVRTFFYFARHPRKLNLGEVLFYMDQTGADAVPIVMLICFLMGMILSFQGVAQLSRFGLSIFVSDLVGHSIVRELGPLMVAIICTGRAGSAFAAEIGTMKVNEELDAMTTMGLKPIYLLVMPKLLGLIIVMPMLTLIGDFVGIIGGGAMAATSSDITLFSYFNRITLSLIPANVMESLVKSVVFAFLVGAIGCFKGFESESDAKGVGGATTSAVVSGVFLIVLADAGVTFTYPLIMRLLGVDY
jgi:phospholipid/cholesterol/gamma-HCH transport system permease protein